MAYLLLLVLVLTLVIVLFLRSRNPPCKKASLSTLIVLGSGGHTAEMLRLASQLDRSKYSPRTYVCAKTDALSGEKAMAEDGAAKVKVVPRAREVRQSLLSSVVTTAVAAVSSYLALVRVAPDLVLCNGPGTCVPFCLGAWVNNKLGISRTKIVFVESVCRVRTLSLSGKIVAWFADEVLVQWPELAQEYPNVKYIARFT